jgi:glycosyltransferase involved in cell wall biosynthesis
MRIWLVTVGEPWPTDGDSPRLHRTGINAGFLAAAGHEVTYWSGTFDHSHKHERTGHDVRLDTAQGWRLIGLFAGGYQRNVSFERIRYHRTVTRRFQEMAKSEPAPDLIVVSLTPLELARAAVEYGKARGIPVIVDVRDMWPDIWAERLPAPLRPFSPLLMKPFYDDRRAAVRGATAIIGITDAAVDWALDAVGRKRGPSDRGFPLVYPAAAPDEAAVAAATRDWLGRGIGANPDEIIGCFFGTFTTRVDFETPLKALAQMSEPLRSRFRLVMCGRGENEALIARYAAMTPQIIHPGWVDAPQIMALMRMSHFGLLPYPPTLDFVRSLPNKVFEYLNGGLPILTSLRGEVEGLFQAYGCGMLYDVNTPASFQAVLAELAAQQQKLEILKQGAVAAATAYDSTLVSRQFEAYLNEVKG